MKIFIAHVVGGIVSDEDQLADAQIIDTGGNGAILHHKIGAGGAARGNGAVQIKTFFKKGLEIVKALVGFHSGHDGASAGQVGADAPDVNVFKLQHLRHIRAEGFLCEIALTQNTQIHHDQHLVLFMVSGRRRVQSLDCFKLGV